MGEGDGAAEFASSFSDVVACVTCRPRNPAVYCALRACCRASLRPGVTQARRSVLARAVRAVGVRLCHVVCITSCAPHSRQADNFEIPCFWGLIFGNPCLVWYSSSPPVRRLVLLYVHSIQGFTMVILLIDCKTNKTFYVSTVDVHFTVKYEKNNTSDSGRIFLICVTAPSLAQPTQVTAYRLQQRRYCSVVYAHISQGICTRSKMQLEKALCNVMQMNAHKCYVPPRPGKNQPTRFRKHTHTKLPITPHIPGFTELDC